MSPKDIGEVELALQGTVIRGPQGPQGKDGIAGPPGNPGNPGAPGADGKPGLQGDRGDPGLPGKDGVDGKDGLTGDTGPAGEPGRDGVDGAPGLPGINGRDGLPGTDGQPGLPGAKGDKGDKGDQGAQGIQGVQGLAGLHGWTPVLALVSDGARRVQQVSDWTGGTGTKPATGQYVSATGLVATAALAVDVRGPSGAGTGSVNPTGSIAANDLAAFADASGQVIKALKAADLPVSAATQTALNGKAPLTGGGTSGTWPINVTGSAATAPWAGISGKPAVIASGIDMAAARASIEAVAVDELITPFITASSTLQPAVDGVQYGLANAAATTLMLPPDPEVGSLVFVVVLNGRSDNILGRSGSLIGGLAENMTINNPKRPFAAKFVGGATGWVIL